MNVVGTRLRQRAKQCNHGYPNGCGPYYPDPTECSNCLWMREAADEIERLRGILNHICDVWRSDLYSITNEIAEIEKGLRND